MSLKDTSIEKVLSKKQLVASSVVYLEDYLKIKTGYIFKTWQTYYCKLMGSCLVCRKNKKDIRPSLMIYLSRTSIWYSNEDKGHPFSFMIYHPERETFLISVETEDKLKLWMNSLKGVKENLKKFDNSDIEDYTSSDEENSSDCTCLGIKWKKIFGLKKNKYHHIIENADFLNEENNKEKKQILDKDSKTKIQVELDQNDKEKFLKICQDMNIQLNIKE